MRFRENQANKQNKDMSETKQNKKVKTKVEPLRTPLLISRVRTQVGHHYRDTLPAGTAGALSAWGGAGGREFITVPRSEVSKLIGKELSRPVKRPGKKMPLLSSKYLGSNSANGQGNEKFYSQKRTISHSPSHTTSRCRTARPRPRRYRSRFPQSIHGIYDA